MAAMLQMCTFLIIIDNECLSIPMRPQSCRLWKKLGISLQKLIFHIMQKFEKKMKKKAMVSFWFGRLQGLICKLNFGNQTYCSNLLRLNAKILVKVPSMGAMPCLFVPEKRLAYCTYLPNCKAIHLTVFVHLMHFEAV